MPTHVAELEVTETRTRPAVRFSICHFTLAHSQLKSRSYHMQCKPLSNLGAEVHFISSAAAHGRDGNVTFIHTPPPAGSFGNVRRFFSLLRTLIRVRADVYHFQDPEALAVAFVLKGICRKRVVFDCYEDFASMALTMQGLPERLRPFAAKLTGQIQKLAAYCFDGVMTADPLTLRGVARSGRSRKLTFYNFPNLDFFPRPRQAVPQFDLVYRGGLSERAGTWLLLDALRLLAIRGKPVRLLLVGYCDNSQVQSALRDRIRLLGLQDSVELQGRVDHEQMAKTLSRARIGICPLTDIPKFRVNIPVKVFEYWACGLPVVASDLPPIRPFFKKTGGGLLCAPGDPKALAQSIAWLLEHPQSAAQMGQRGRTAIETRFTHQRELRKLARFFGQIAAQS